MSLLMDALKKAEAAKKTYQPNDPTLNSPSNSLPTTGAEGPFFPENDSQPLQLNEPRAKASHSENLASQPAMVTDSFQVFDADHSEPFQQRWNRDFLKELEDDDELSQTVTTFHSEESPAFSIKDWEIQLRPEFRDSDTKEEVIPFYEEGLRQPVADPKTVDVFTPLHDLKPSQEEAVAEPEPVAPPLSKVSEVPKNLEVSNQVKAFSLREWQQESISLSQPAEVTTPSEDTNPFGPSPLELGFYTAKPQAEDKKQAVEKPFPENTLPPEPATAQRLLAAGAPQPSYRTNLVYALFGTILLSIGIVSYYYSPWFTPSSLQPSATGSLFKKPPLTQPTSPAVANPGKSVHDETKGVVANSTPKPLQPPPVPPVPSKLPADAASSPLLTANPSSTLAAAKVVATELKQQETVLTEAKTPAKPVSSPPKSEESPKEKESPPTKPKLEESKPPPDTPKVANEKPPVKSDKPDEIQLRKMLTQQINTEVSSAYSAFQRGDEKSAERVYNQVLQQDPNNHDALLGLAAVAIRRGDIQTSQQYYRRVLKLYPKDTYAQVGLINTLDNRSHESESQLKLLLEKAPQAAYIHFSLGNLYANQGRWAAAQQAYFDAYRYDNNKADYIYNLAVSLDQLNQPTVALNYYQTALQLGRTQAVSFSSQAVQRRVQTLLKHAP